MDPLTRLKIPLCWVFLFFCACRIPLGHAWGPDLPADQFAPIPKLTAHVTDLTQTISPQEQQQLEQKLISWEKKNQIQIAVLMIPTTQPESIEQYGIRLAETWKIGQQKIDNGLTRIQV